MSRTLISAAAILALGLAGCAQNAETPDASAAVPASQSEAPAPKPAPPKPQTASVPAGTMIEVRMETTLNSGTSQVGDTFTAEVIEPVVVDGREVIPAGSTVRGSVAAVSRAKRGAGNASMTLAFSELKVSGGSQTAISASLTEQSESKKKRNAAVIGGSAAGGALLGRIIGKDTKGAVVGAVAGGAIGTGVILSKEGEQVNIPSGAELTIQLDEGIKVPRR